MLFSHQKEIASHLKSIEHFENRFNNKIIEAKIYPTSAVVIFIVNLVSTIIFVSYLLLK